jgi:hypothetical protein
LDYPLHPPTHPHYNFEGTSRQLRKLIFGMQPYFDQTRKITSFKKWKTTSKKIKMEDELNKNENGR